MSPAVLEVGEEEARAYNRERRDTYRSAEEQQLAWLRAHVRAKQPSEDDRHDRRLRRPPDDARAPTTATAHADWPGLFEKSLEDALRRHRPALHDRPRQHVDLGLGGTAARGATLAGLVAGRRARRP